VQISQTKTEGRGYLEHFLERTPWKWTKSRGGFSCSSKQLWHAFHDIGDSCYRKRVPAWIRFSSVRIINAFLNGAIAGDGWSQGGVRRYTSSSRDLAGDIQELFLKCGRSVSLLHRDAKAWAIREKTGMSRDTWVAHEHSSAQAGLIDHSRKRAFSDVRYEGFVYCVTVPNHTVITRRNGKILVSGNCLEYAAAYNPPYRSPQPVVETAVNPAFTAFLAKLSRQEEGAGSTFGVSVR